MELLDSVEALEECLSRPTETVCETLNRVEGDWILLGAGGKMGPTLARMIRRGLNEIGRTKAEVFAVSRFSDKAAAASLKSIGVKTIECDLLDRQQVSNLPQIRNVLSLVGNKFGTGKNPSLTWAMNTLAPANIMEHFSESRVVAFSTGCVYPLTSIESRGANEETPLDPPGEYANSCVGRERIYGYYSQKNQTQLLQFRLSYAIETRYGVLLDVAHKVFSGKPVDVSMGFANVIWQGDANARAIQSIEHASIPEFPLNVTGKDKIAIRVLAWKFGELFDKKPVIIGDEAESAWIFDAARSFELFGDVEVDIHEMIELVAHWVRKRLPTYDKPTHFEVRNGKY